MVGKFCIVGLPFVVAEFIFEGCFYQYHINRQSSTEYPYFIYNFKISIIIQMCFASTQMFNGVQLEHTTKCMEKSVSRKNSYTS